MKSPGTTYERARPSGELRSEPSGWIAAPDYDPEFGEQTHEAASWIENNPETFNNMVGDLDYVIDFLNTAEGGINKNMFPNMAEFRQLFKDTSLPLLREREEQQKPSYQITAKSIGAIATGFRLGYTTAPDNPEASRKQQLPVKDAQGMVAIGLLDLYENYVHSLGLYPEDADNPTVVSSAITELLYSTRTAGELFQALKDPANNWVYGQDAFSQSFQEVLYGDGTLQTTRPLKGD